MIVACLTGSYLAAVRYSTESLVGSGRGHLVLTMVACLLALSALLHVGTGRLTDRLAADDVDAATGAASPWYRAASVVAALVLILAGLL